MNEATVEQIVALAHHCEHFAGRADREERHGSLMVMAVFREQANHAAREAFRLARTAQQVAA